mgnify:CR=1 FL=1|tara:strand:+ start:388 stop:522 length:135 start_codon:yes stop_codon:yes gene_type:complete
MDKKLIEEAIRFLQMTKEEAQEIDIATLQRLVHQAKKQWIATLH